MPATWNGVQDAPLPSIQGSCFLSRRFHRDHVVTKGAISMFGHRLVAILGLICASLCGLATRAAAQNWDLSRDFSTSANPTGVWSYGSKTSLNAGLNLYADTARTPAHYGTSQLAGWTDPTLAIVP